MKKVLISMMVLFVTSLIYCEKDETLVPKSVQKQDFKQCRGCSGSWDLIDTMP